MVCVSAINSILLPIQSDKRESKNNDLFLQNNYVSSTSNIYQYLTFNGFANQHNIHRFKKTDWSNAREIFDKVELIDDQEEYVNIIDFINNGKNSKLAKNIPILRECFDYCLPFRIRGKNTTVGKHIQDVVSHLYYVNDEFKQLPQEDKKLLLKTAVFHDIGKFENKLYKSDLSRPDFETMIRDRIKEFEIFNAPEDYISYIKDYFQSHPDETELILHNNRHRKESAALIHKYITGNAENEQELKDVEFLVLNHENFGEIIDKNKLVNKYKNDTLDEEILDNYAQILAQDIPNKRFLKLIKIFHLSDASTIQQKDPDHYNNFGILLNKLYEKALAIVEEM